MYKESRQPRFKSFVNLDKLSLPESYHIPKSFSPAIQSQSSLSNFLLSNQDEKKEDIGLFRKRYGKSVDNSASKISQRSSLPKLESSPSYRVFLDQSISVNANANERIKHKMQTERKMKLLDVVLELKKSIHFKYQDSVLILPERSDLKKAVNSLEMISYEDTPYFDLMQNIVKLVRMGLYFNKELLKKSEHLWKALSDQSFNKLASVPDDHSIPYYTVCTLLLKELNNQKEQIRKQSTEFTQNLNEQKDVLEEKYRVQFEEKKRDQLKEMDKFKADCKSEQYKLEVKIHDLTAKLKEAETRIYNLLHENLDLRESINEQKLEIKELNAKIGQLNDALKQKDRLFQESNEKKFIAKSEFETVRATANNIFSEFEKFKEMVKAISQISSDGLTPRPDFQQMINEKNIEHFFSLEEKIQKTSTARLFENVLSRYAAAMSAEAINKQNQSRRGSFAPQKGTPARRSSKESASKMNRFGSNPNEMLRHAIESHAGSKSEFAQNRENSLDSERRSRNDTQRDERLKDSVSLSRQDFDMASQDNEDHTDPILMLDGEQQSGDILIRSQKEPQKEILDRSLNESSILGDKEGNLKLRVIDTNPRREQLKAIEDKIGELSERLSERVNQAKIMFDEFLSSHLQVNIAAK